MLSILVFPVSLFNYTLQILTVEVFVKHVQMGIGHRISVLCIHHSHALLVG